MKTKNGHILTFSVKMQITAVSCSATCDWFCPMTSQMEKIIDGFEERVNERINVK